MNRPGVHAQPPGAIVQNPGCHSVPVPGGSATQRGGVQTNALPVHSQCPGSSVSLKAETGGFSSGTMAPRASGTVGQAGDGAGGGGAQLASEASKPAAATAMRALTAAP